VALTFDPDSYFSNGEWKDAVDPSKNLYERIGLHFEDNHSLNDIKAAFHKRYDWWREVNKRYNSNPANTKTKDTGPVSKEAMEKLHDAYVVLGNSEKKRAYDEGLKKSVGKKALSEFIKMVHIVLADKILTQEGKKILLNCALTLHIEKTRALEIISAEIIRTGSSYREEKPARIQESALDYYKLLEIDYTAANSEIEAAYNKQYLIWNSLSSNPKFKESALNKLKLLQQALDVLLDRDKRHKYDKQFLQPVNTPLPNIREKKNKLLPVLIYGGSLLAVLVIAGIVLLKKNDFYEHSTPVTAQKLKSHESVVHTEEIIPHNGWLGVVVQDIDADLARAFNVSRTEGTLVSDIIANSPAKNAGFKCGDIVLEYNGKPIRHVNHFLYIVSQTKVGSTAKIKVSRDNEVFTLEAIVGEKPPELSVPDPSTIPHEKKIGLSVQNITREIVQSLGLEETDGIIVSDVEPGSRSALSGLRKGDIIDEVNKKEINSVADLRRSLGTFDSNKAFRIHIKRGSFSAYMMVKEKKE